MRRSFKREQIVRDAVPTEPRYDDVGELLFSEDGNHLVAAVQIGKVWHVERDSSAGPPFEEISSSA